MLVSMGTVCLVSVRGHARQARTDEFELDEGFQPYHPPSDSRIVRLILAQVPCCGFLVLDSFVLKIPGARF